MNNLHGTLDMYFRYSLYNHTEHHYNKDPNSYTNRMQKNIFHFVIFIQIWAMSEGIRLLER